MDKGPDNIIDFTSAENKILSDKEKKFVEFIFQGLGKKQAALEAGYAQSAAHVQATRLLKKDKIKKALDRLRSLQHQQTIHTMDKEIESIDAMIQEARERGQIGAAVQAARLKAQMLGYLVDKKEIKTTNLDTMSEDDIVNYLDSLKASYSNPQ